MYINLPLVFGYGIISKTNLSCHTCCLVPNPQVLWTCFVAGSKMTDLADLVEGRSPK